MARLQGPAASSRAVGGSRVLQRAHRIVDRARELTDHPVLTHVARVGLVAYGAMHLLIAYLALRLAWGVDVGDADQTGALQTVAAGPGGTALLWALALGMLALALWQAGEVLLWWHRLFRGTHRIRTAVVIVKCLAKAAVYGVLGVTGLLFAVGLDYQADERLQDLTDDTLEIPGGAALVLLAAAGVVAVGLYTLARGITAGFMRDIDLPAAPDRYEPLIELLGRIGYVAKGVAFVLVGVLLWQAAISSDVSTATGLDGAMTSIAGLAAGTWSLTAVAAGFAAFGVYALARARYPDRDPSS